MLGAAGTWHVGACAVVGIYTRQRTRKTCYVTSLEEGRWTCATTRSSALHRLRAALSFTCASFSLRVAYTISLPHKVSMSPSFLFLLVHRKILIIILPKWFDLILESYPDMPASAFTNTEAFLDFGTTRNGRDAHTYVNEMTFLRQYSATLTTRKAHEDSVETGRMHALSPSLGIGLDRPWLSKYLTCTFGFP